MIERENGQIRFRRGGFSQKRDQDTMECKNEINQIEILEYQSWFKINTQLMSECKIAN